MKRASRGLLAGLLVSFGLGGNALEAQYFGRNRVQYEDFDFKVLETEHFDIHYYAEEEEAARLAGVMAERWYGRLSGILNHELRGRQVIIYYANHPHFEQTNAIGVTPTEGTGGVTEVFKRRIVLPFAGPLGETDHVLGHELVHAFQFDMSGQGKTISETSYPTALRLPLWFIEGMAEYLSVGPDDPHTAMWIRDALQHDRLPTLRQLYDPRFFPYRFGQAFWAYIAGRWGDEVVGRVLNAASRVGSAESALQLVLRVSPDSLIAEWHEAIRFSYGSVRDSTQAPSEYGVPILTKANAGTVNVSPVVSPDGSRVVFLSEKDEFSIEMFMAAAETGEVLNKIVKTSVDPHYESLEFIGSAGAWAPDGRRFVFGAVAKGQPVLSILDTETGNVVREIHVREVGEVVNPTWSPDGSRIAFSALVGGLSDLFVYHFDGDSVHRVTKDAYADLQPAWSPDGRSVAFVTDRFSTDLSAYAFGNYGLATWNPRTDSIDALPTLVGAKHINPQWSADAQSVFFVADPDGVSNVYRLDLVTGDVFRITNLFAGVSGITDLSPALTIADRANRLLFSAFENGEYNVYRIDGPNQMAGEPVSRTLVREPGAEPPRDIGEVLVDRNAGFLPPTDREPGLIEQYLARPRVGLADANSFGSEGYSAKLSLDYLSQPYLSFGVDDYGTFIGAGIAAYWSDMLGAHNLATVFQIQGSFKDIGALVGYTNRQSRWNWGLVAGQTPYVTGITSVGIGWDEEGRPVYIEQQMLIRQYNRQVTGIVAYPFNRVRRMEFELGARNIGFSSEIRTRIIDATTRQLLDVTRLDRPVCYTDPRTGDQVCQEGGINMLSAGVALVYDNAVFGGTSPVLGQRYRLEVGPNWGTLTFVDGLADFRKYLMPARPFTLAGRLSHYGRYGPDAEDPVLSDFYLGSPGLVRGYDYYSFEVAECAASIADGDEQQLRCPVQDQLFGSHIGVVSLELRFPPLSVLGLGNALFGAMPIEAVVFGDAGVAWERDNEAFFLGGDRDLVYSAGVGLRFNLFNLLIAELDFVQPFQRPDKGWHWQFGFTPGF